MLMRDIRKHCYIIRETALLRKADEKVRLLDTGEGDAVTKLTADVGALLTVADDGKLMGAD